MAEKRYYWLKLQDDFFNSLRIKKLRKLAGGDTFTIIYLKMQLLAMKKDGVLEYKGLEDSFSKELALELDEDDDNVDVTVRYLLSCGLLETSNERKYFVPYAVENTGSEGSSAKRMREARAKSVTLCEQSATLCAHRYGEKEIEIEKEIEVEIEESMEPPAAPPTPTPEPPKAVRHKYGEYGRVKLTDEQYARLLKDLGEEELKRCITYVDESAQLTRNKNKWSDWNLVVRKCHREGWGMKQYGGKNTGQRNVATSGADRLLEMLERGEFNDD